MDIKTIVSCVGRKFGLVLLVIFLSSMILVIPPFLGKNILSDGNYVALITMIVSAYFGVNAALLHPTFDKNIAALKVAPQVVDDDNSIRGKR